VSRIRQLRAAKRLRFAAKERKFVTGEVTNFVALTFGVIADKYAAAVKRCSKMLR
jgi:hypothetical protein